MAASIILLTIYCKKNHNELIMNIMIFLSFFFGKEQTIISQLRPFLINDDDVENVGPNVQMLLCSMKVRQL